MIYLVRVMFLFFFLGLSSLGYAQNAIDDHGTGTANHNYFVANQEPTLKLLLSHVENRHFINCPHNFKSPLGDIRNGRYDYAIGDLDYVLTRFVNHPKALAMLSAVSKVAKTPLLPIRYFEKALKLYPKYAATHFQYGSHLLDVGNTSGAIIQFKNALKIDTGFASAYVGLAKAYQKRGDLELARQSTERAKALGYKSKTTSGPRQALGR